MHFDKLRIYCFFGGWVFVLKDRFFHCARGAGG